MVNHPVMRGQVKGAASARQSLQDGSFKFLLIIIIDVVDVVILFV